MSGLSNFCAAYSCEPMALATGREGLRYHYKTRGVGSEVSESRVHSSSNLALAAQMS